MTRFKTCMTLLVVAAMAFSFTSCDDDPWYGDRWYDGWDDYGWWNDGYIDPQNTDYMAMANMLAGNWQGTTIATFVNQDNQTVTQQYHTEINFTQAKDGAIFGTGLQNDFTGDNTTADYSRNFIWYIDDTSGDIHLQYFTADNVQAKYEMVISYDDLVLDQRRFTGRIVALDNTEQDEFDWYYFQNTAAKRVTITFEGE